MQTYTVCTRSSYPISYSKLQYKMVHYFLDTRYLTNDKRFSETLNRFTKETVILNGIRQTKALYTVSEWVKDKQARR